MMALAPASMRPLVGHQPRQLAALGRPARATAPRQVRRADASALRLPDRPATGDRRPANRPRWAVLPVPVALAARARRSCGPRCARQRCGAGSGAWAMAAVPARTVMPGDDDGSCRGSLDACCPWPPCAAGRLRPMPHRGARTSGVPRCGPMRRAAPTRRGDTGVGAGALGPGSGRIRSTRRSARAAASNVSTVAPATANSRGGSRGGRDRATSDVAHPGAGRTRHCEPPGRFSDRPTVAKQSERHRLGRCSWCANFPVACRADVVVGRGSTVMGERAANRDGADGPGDGSTPGPAAAPGSETDRLAQAPIREALHIVLGGEEEQKDEEGEEQRQQEGQSWPEHAVAPHSHDGGDTAAAHPAIAGPLLLADDGHADGHSDPDAVGLLHHHCELHDDDAANDGEEATAVWHDGFMAAGQSDFAGLFPTAQVVRGRPLARGVRRPHWRTGRARTSRPAPIGIRGTCDGARGADCAMRRAQRPSRRSIVATRTRG